MTTRCPFCDLLKTPQNDSTFIAEFEHSVAYLNYEQKAYPGQSILILKDHHEHLHLTPLALQQAIVPELAQLTAAVLKAFGGFRANHQSLGNRIAHVHWHVVPRYPGDLNTGSAPGYVEQDKLSDDDYRQLATRVRMALDYPDFKNPF